MNAWNAAGGWIAIVGVISLIVLYSKVVVDVLVEAASRGYVAVRHGGRYWVWLAASMAVLITGVGLVVANQP